MNKPKTYHSKGDEALRIVKGEQTVIVMPMKPQPEDCTRIHRDHVFSFIRDAPMHLIVLREGVVCVHCSSNAMPSPLGQPGDIIHVKEKWYYGHYNGDGNICDDPKCGHWHYDYYADNPFERPGDISESYCIHMWGRNKEDWPRWKSPVTMPLEAVRAKPVIKKVEVKRVQEITKDECEKWQTLRQIELYFAAVNHFGLKVWENNDYVWVYTVGGEK